jgi:ADP-heptose:LPS heptosyltransferase
MTLPKEINVFRRFLMRKITKNIGSSHSGISGIQNKLEIKRVLICRPNQRLGNLLLITPLIEEVSTAFPNCKIDLFVKGFLGPILFKNYKNVNLIFELPKKPFDHLLKYFLVWHSIRKQQYDLVINVDKNSSSGRLATQFSKSKFKFFGDEAEISQLRLDDEHFAKFPVYNFRSFLTQLGFKASNDSVAPLNLKLSTIEIGKGREIVSNLVGNENKTICLFTFATGEKCYSTTWWEQFYERLKSEFPNYNFIEVLPVENISQISFKAPTFYSKDVREIGSVIANTQLFIGADSGIMHLSSSVNTPTLGLFSVTDLNKYGPYNNQSIGINTNEINSAEFINLLHFYLTPVKRPLEFVMEY